MKMGSTFSTISERRFTDFSFNINPPPVKVSQKKNQIDGFLLSGLGGKQSSLHKARLRKAVLFVQ